MESTNKLHKSLIYTSNAHRKVCRSYFAKLNLSDGQPKVLDAASELLIQIFGDNGKAARSAIGVNVLPNNQPVEIQLTCKLKI